MKFYCWLLLLCTGLFAACRQHPKPISFYYWKTRFQLKPVEREVLQQEAVNALYVRYFDVDFEPSASTPAPVSPIQLDSSIRRYTVVPVIFIKNRTFERTDSAMVPWLAKNVLYLVAAISRSQGLTPREIQFDCDWTERTRDKYFNFIRQFQAVSGKTISATIRLHQVKYKERTGIPPVDYGVLMYYNMGAITGDDRNSIYEKSTASRYNSYIKSYPLPLDVALPIFSWGLTVRDGKVTQLLNKLDAAALQNDSNITRIDDNRFRVNHACFKEGYYFRENDEIKLERVPESNLLDIAQQVNSYSNHRINKLIFYDLDSNNLVHYEKDVFEKVRNSIH
jgi:hypothetical protein